MVPRIQGVSVSVQFACRGPGHHLTLSVILQRLPDTVPEDQRAFALAFFCLELTDAVDILFNL